jgi:hypothetical protein
VSDKVGETDLGVVDVPMDVIAVEKPAFRDELGFQGGLLFKAHRPLYHSTLGSRSSHREEEEGV